MMTATPTRYLTHTWFRIALAAVALIQIGVLLKTVIGHQSLINTGREITVAVEPVDPRDLFRGDYVILGYAFSRPKKSQLDAAMPFDQLRRDDSVYVTLLNESGNIWRPVSVAREHPGQSAAGNKVVVKGRVISQWPLGALPQGGNDAEANIVYGIERYYVPEGTGTELEQKVRDQTVEAILAIGSDGTAAIKGVAIGGERHVDPPLF